MSHHSRSEIIPPGIITRTVDGEGNVLKTYLSYGTEKEYPIVVLVNGFSAPLPRSFPVRCRIPGRCPGGHKTYGKATVQHLERIAGNRGLSYTVAKYQTPKDATSMATAWNPIIMWNFLQTFILSGISCLMTCRPEMRAPQC